MKIEDATTAIDVFIENGKYRNADKLYNAFRMGSNALKELKDLENKLVYMADYDCYNEDQKARSETYEQIAVLIDKIIKRLEK